MLQITKKSRHCKNNCFHQCSQLGTILCPGDMWQSWEKPVWFSQLEWGGAPGTQKAEARDAVRYPTVPESPTRQPRASTSNPRNPSPKPLSGFHWPGWDQSLIAELIAVTLSGHVWSHVLPRPRWTAGWTMNQDAIWLPVVVAQPWPTAENDHPKEAMKEDFFFQVSAILADSV